MTSKHESESEQWHDVGAAEELRQKPVQQVVVKGVRIALSYRDGTFGAISGANDLLGRAAAARWS